MIAVEVLIKSGLLEKKINFCFSSTFTEADWEPSQTSKLEIFVFNCFKPFTILQQPSSKIFDWFRNTPLFYDNKIPQNLTWKDTSQTTFYVFYQTNK